MVANSNSKRKVLLEKRIKRLEKLIKESSKEAALSELRDVIDSLYNYTWTVNGEPRPRVLRQLRKEIVDIEKDDLFGDVVNDIEVNEGDALSYYGSGDPDSLWENDELDDDIIDIVDSMLARKRK